MSSTSLLGRPAATSGPVRRFDNRTVILVVIGFMVVLAAVRLITGASELTSSGTIGTALRLAVPIGLAGLGGLWSERAGVVNIGLEGMMVLGTWFGAWAGVVYGPWWGVVAGIIGGAIGGLLHALATVTFRVDHIISGVAITLLAEGVTRFLSAQVFDKMEGGDEGQSPTIGPIDTVTLPWLSEAMRTIEKKQWFLVSDVAGLLGGLITDVSLLTIVAVLLIPLTFLVLWRTAFGLRLRSCGERPVAAESLGVNVYYYKYVAVVASGAFAGLGGAFLAIVGSTIYKEGQVGGRGYIGLAAMIFGNWRPGGLAMGAGLFGYTDALQWRSGEVAVHALLLLLAVLIGALGVWRFTQGQTIMGGVAVGLAAAILAWFLLTDTVPREFVNVMPYITTLLVLALASQRLRMPAADGLPYARGQGG